MYSKSTPEKRLAFLSALAATCNVSKAAEAVGLDRSTLYGWRDEDAEFAALWERAKAIGADALEDEAVRRAHEGVLEPVFHQGMECGTIRKYSDTLTIFLLKGAKPEKYRERQEVVHAGGQSLVVLTGVPNADDISDLI